MVRVLLFNVDIIMMMLSCRYLGHSGDTMLIPNLQFEIIVGGNIRKLFIKVISFKILSKESRIGYPRYDT